MNSVIKVGPFFLFAKGSLAQKTSPSQGREESELGKGKQAAACSMSDSQGKLSDLMMCVLAKTEARKRIKKKKKVTQNQKSERNF